jgi:hypothetical protein
VNHANRLDPMLGIRPRGISGNKGQGTVLIGQQARRLQSRGAITGEKKSSLCAEAAFFHNVERDKRLELSTYTLARYRSTN